MPIPSVNREMTLSRKHSPERINNYNGSRYTHCRAAPCCYHWHTERLQLPTKQSTDRQAGKTGRYESFLSGRPIVIYRPDLVRFYPQASHSSTAVRRYATHHKLSLICWQYCLQIRSRPNYVTLLLIQIDLKDCQIWPPCGSTATVTPTWRSHGWYI